jgi:hypothetical protein
MFPKYFVKVVFYYISQYKVNRIFNLERKRLGEWQWEIKKENPDLAT